jgi:hypothetical protein
MFLYSILLLFHFLHMKTLRLLPIVVLIFVLPLKSNAWGLLGHRVVGEIAERNLTAKAKKAVQAILGDTSMAIAANWADFIKSDTNYRYVSSWHYLDFKDGLSFNDIKLILVNDTTANVYNKTVWIIKELKNKKLSKDKQKFYLRLLIHFIGDMHQPLHHGNETDQGGNKVKVTWFGEATNLHSVWDSKLIEDQQLSYTEYSTLLNHPTAAQKLAWQKQPMSEWIYESYQVSRDIYANTPADSKLSYTYNYRWIDVANKQMLKGGVRLAGVLNDIFK